MPDPNLISLNDIPCCPELSKDPCCDRLQFSYRLINRQADLPVEITIVAELERCPGPLALGDVVYSTTLLPGEKVRLNNSSRNSRFTYDADSEVTYRHEQASEETFYMSSMDRFLSDLSVSQSSSGSASSDSEFETEGSVSNWTDAIFGRPDAKVEGEFSAESSFDFMSDLSRHAEASHERTVQGTRAANSIAMGEVQSRQHAEGESESAYEASTRVIENKNECHAVSYFAYQLVKRQTTRFSIKAVYRRVIDPAGNATAEVRPLRANSSVAVIPGGVLATKADRLELETAGRTSAAAKRANIISPIDSKGAGFAAVGDRLAVAPSRVTFGTATAAAVKPISTQERVKALQTVDQSLVKAGILDKVGGKVAPQLQAEFGFEKVSCLPTQAIVVKGCIDDCNVCEDSRQKGIQLDLVHKDLQNKLLAKQIELLAESQEYRCCPIGEVEDAPTP